MLNNIVFCRKGNFIYILNIFALDPLHQAMKNDKILKKFWYAVCWRTFCHYAIHVTIHIFYLFENFWLVWVVGYHMISTVYKRLNTYVNAWLHNISFDHGLLLSSWTGHCLFDVRCLYQLSQNIPIAANRLTDVKIYERP